MSGATLTEWNFETGRLTNRQMTEYAGFPVVVARLSELPHWNVILQSVGMPDKDRDERFAVALRERSEAIYDLLDQAGLTKRHGGSFTPEDAGDFARARYPVVRSTAWGYAVPAGLEDHFQKIQALGVERAVDQTTSRFWGPNPGREMPFVMPGVLSEQVPVRSKLEQITAFKKCAAVMLVNGDGDTLKEVWAMELGLPAGQALRMPDPKIHHLICELHERRHLLQVNFNPSSRTADANTDQGVFNEYIVKYYEEADADMAAHSQLRQTTVGPKDKIDEALSMDRKKRYMGMLFNHPKYWMAPFLDAVEKGEKPPDFYSVHQSVMEIRLRLLAEADRLEIARAGLVPSSPVLGEEINRAVAGWRRYPGASSYDPVDPKQIAGTSLTSSHMVEPKGETTWKGLDNLYLAWRDDQFYEKPEVFYTLLQKSLQKGDFDSNLLTKKIATKIVEAADFFNPSLTREENVEAKIKIPRVAPLRKIEAQPFLPSVRIATVPETFGAAQPVGAC